MRGGKPDRSGYRRCRRTRADEGAPPPRSARARLRPGREPRGADQSVPPDSRVAGIRAHQTERATRAKLARAPKCQRPLRRNRPQPRLRPTRAATRRSATSQCRFRPPPRRPACPSREGQDPARSQSGGDAPRARWSGHAAASPRRLPCRGTRNPRHPSESEGAVVPPSRASTSTSPAHPKPPPATTAARRHRSSATAPRPSRPAVQPSHPVPPTTAARSPLV
jgi:hypothetical protein